MTDLHYKLLAVTINNYMAKDKLEKHELLLYVQACHLMQKFYSLMERHIDKANSDFDQGSAPQETPPNEES